jgi:hypothetical protein
MSPVISTYGAASANGFGIFKADLGGGAWVNLITGPSANDTYPTMFIDNSLNSYIVVNRYSGAQGSGNYWPNLIKFNSAGTIQWQRYYPLNVSTTQAIPGGGVDSAGNIWFGGLENSGSTYGVYLFKVDSSGSQLVQRRYNNGNSSNAVGRTMSVSPSGTYVGIQTTAGGSLSPNGVLFSLAGNLQYQNSTNESSQGYFHRAADDGTICLSLGPTQNVVGPSQNSWQWATASSSTCTGAMCWNTSGMMFALPTSGSNCDIQRINPSTGASVWAKRLSGMSNMSRYSGVAANATYNYALYTFGTTKQMLIVKRANSDGTIQWQRTISALSNGGLTTFGPDSTNGYTIAVDANDKFFFIQHYYEANGTYQSYLWKLPADGTKTGTVTPTFYNATYAASSYTEGTFTSSRPTTSIGPLDPSLTTANGALSITTTSSYSRTNFPIT